MTVRMLRTLQELERAVGDLYRDYIAAFPEEAELWARLSAAERRHEELLGEMVRMVQADPALFSPGRPLNEKVVMTTVSGVRSQQAALTGEGRTLRQALFIARDLEQSILESKYKEIVESRSQAYTDWLSRILQETVEHRMWLEEGIARHPE